MPREQEIMRIYKKELITFVKVERSLWRKGEVDDTVVVGYPGNVLKLKMKSWTGRLEG
jgi:hypothetical protein